MARPDPLKAAREGARRPGTTAVLAGSAVAGVGGYLFQVLGTRSLGDEAFAPIGVLWTIHYLALTVGLISVEAHVTRTITLHGDEPDRVRGSLQAMTIWVGVVAATLGVAAFLGRRALFGQDTAELALVVAVTVGGYGGFVIIRGWLAGVYRFRQYAFGTALESLARLAAAGVVGVVAATSRSFAWTLAVAPWAVVAWWGVVVHRRPYRVPSRPVDPAGLPQLATGSAGRYLAATTAANAANQTLLAAGPLVLLPLGAGPAEVSVFFVTVTAARIPLVFAFGGLLSRVLPPLTRAARAGRHGRLRGLALLVTGGAVVLGAVGAAAGAWIGPDVVTLFFGAAFRPPGWLVAATAAGVIGATGALGLNQLLIAMGVEQRLVLPWLAALTAGAVTILLVDGSASMQVISGFVAGEAAALVGLTAAVLTYRPAPPRTEPPLPPTLRVGE